MQIRELSKLTGISLTAIRYYEKVGVLPKPVKGINGYREYSEDRATHLKMIGKAKALGFTLSEIKDLSTLLFSKKLSQRDMAKRLKKKQSDIDFKIKSLQRMKLEIGEALAGLCEHKNRLG